MAGEQATAVRAGALLAVAHQAAEVAVPLLVGLVLDRAVGTGDGAALGRWLAVLAAVFAALSAAGCTALYVQDRAVARSAHRIRTELGRRVVDPAGGLDGLGAGDLVSRSTVEAARWAEGIGARIVAAGAVAGTVVAAGALLTISWSLGLVVLLGLPVLLLAVQALTVPLVARAEAQQAAVARASASAADLVSGIRVLKGLGAEAAAAGRYRRASRSALDAALDATAARARYVGVALAVGTLFLGVVAWLGGRQALDGSIDVSELVAALGVTQFLVGPLGRLAEVGGVLTLAGVAAGRIEEVLRAGPAVGHRVPAPAPGTGTRRPGGALEVEVRRLRHGPLAGLDLDVAAGEVLAVVAVDPVDALALVACLGREVDPSDGEVTVDGTDLASLPLEEARRRVLVVDHGTVLLEAELGANLGGAGDDVLRAARVDDVLDAVPGGRAADVGDGGRALSGGQRQRVALARALGEDPDVLVLHEPTTAVDAVTEARIAADLRTVRAGRTTLLVTASPALLAVADRVVVLEGGQVVDEGTHRSLLAGSAAYRRAVLG